MPSTEPNEVTRLLAAVGEERTGAAEKLLTLVYDELRRLAASYLRAERPGHTLEATALVHEAFLKLVDQEHVAWRDRLHFFHVAATAMRRILVDHARSRRAAKRGGERARVPLDDVVATLEARGTDIVALGEALERLSAFDEQKARTVELRFFGGLTVAETADALGISRRAVEREWTLARAWLRGEITSGDDREP